MRNDALKKDFDEACFANIVELEKGSLTLLTRDTVVSALKVCLPPGCGKLS